jgi:hypothetical protein
MIPAGKFLILAGLVLAAAGVLLMFTEKIPFLGKLPGDICIKRDNVRFYFPVTTSLLLSAVLSLVLWLISIFNRK